MKLTNDNKRFFNCVYLLLSVFNFTFQDISEKIIINKNIFKNEDLRKKTYKSCCFI